MPVGKENFYLTPGLLSGFRVLCQKKWNSDHYKDKLKNESAWTVGPNAMVKKDEHVF